MNPEYDRELGWLKLYLVGSKDLNELEAESGASTTERISSQDLRSVLKKRLDAYLKEHTRDQNPLGDLVEGAFRENLSESALKELTDRKERAKQSDEEGRTEKKQLKSESDTRSSQAQVLLSELHDDAEVLELLSQYLSGKASFRQIEREHGLKRESLQRRFKEAHGSGFVKTNPPHDREAAAKLVKAWGNCRYYCLNANDDTYFFNWAARVFLEELDDLLKKLDKETLNIGVVSGRTTGRMIQAVSSMSWYDNIIQLNRVPGKVGIYALNVTQTYEYEQLEGNSNVLAWQLARKFREVCPEREIEAYGLSTDLFQSYEDSRKSDTRPLTKEVIEVTDPERLGASLAAQEVSEESSPMLESQGRAGDEEPPPAAQSPMGSADETERDVTTDLDLVITGVGPWGDSLFRRYCQENEIEIGEDIVGDIAYWPVNRWGDQVEMMKDGRKYVFYSAIRLDVLKSMVNARTKKVIAIARGPKKVKAIYAAVRKPYCDVLITDAETASNA